MTTVIRSSNSVFNAENILPSGSLVLDGLVAAFRPSNKQDGLIDLSGHGHILTKMGSPTLTSQEMVGDSSNGYTTDIDETVNLTYIAVYKVLPTSGNYQSLAINCFNNTPAEGSSIYSGAASAKAELRCASTVLVASTGSSAVLNHPLDNPVSSADVSNYIFVAHVVNAATGNILSYTPVNGAIVSTEQGVGRSLANRPLSRRKVSLAYSPTTPTWLGKSHIAEALIYNKALTAEQIMMQYNYSKAFMASRGITI